MACSRRRYQWCYVFGFVHPASGRTEWWLASTVSATGMSAVLDAFARAVGAGPKRRIVLALDGAGWHTSKDLRVPEGVHLVFQPAYSPELQPSEQLWPLLHEAVANRDFTDLGDLMRAVDERCCELSAQPRVVKGRTHFHWWPADFQPDHPERAAS